MKTNCTECTSGYFLQEKLLDKFTHSCIVGCNDNQYTEITESGKTCADCDITCAACTGPESIDCTSCPQNAFMLTLGEAPP